MTILLMGVLGSALAIVLSMRRIHMRDLEWWLVFVVAACCFLVGRMA